LEHTGDPFGGSIKGPFYVGILKGIDFERELTSKSLLGIVMDSILGSIFTLDIRGV
jgi:hypothetical protein